MKRRNIVLPMAGTAVAIAIAGCGSSGSESSSKPQTIVTVVEKTVQATPPAVTQTVTTAAPAPAAKATAPKPAAPEEVSKPKPKPAAIVEPNVTGQRLDVAEMHLDAKRLRYREVGGGTFGVVVRSNWNVCSQEPSAGAKNPGRVNLIVGRPDEC
jgi:hypothetical protein